MCNTLFAQSNWQEVGITSTALNVSSAILNLCVDSNDNVFATGTYYINAKHSINQWNGSNWNALGNCHAAGDGRVYCLFTDSSNTLYAAGDFTNLNNNTYVSVLEDTGWFAIPENDNWQFNGDIEGLCKDNAGNIYATGAFTEPNTQYPCVAKYNPLTGWSELGGFNTNSLATAAADLAGLFIDDSNDIFVAYLPVNASSQLDHAIGMWNGTSWIRVDSTSWLTYFFDGNKTLTALVGKYESASPYALDSVGFIRWDKQTNTWSPPLVGSYTRPITSNIVADKSGNLYAAVQKDTAGKYQVEKWDGNLWTQVGNLNANGVISSLCLDNHNNIYAAGSFTDGNRFCYVAKYDLNQPTAVNDIPLLQAKLYPNPAVDFIDVKLTDLGTSQNISYKIMNTSGQTLIQAETKGPDLKLDVGQLQNGLYIIKFTGNYSGAVKFEKYAD